MKSLLGAGALVLAMGLGAWSSDAFPRDDAPRDQGRLEKQDVPDQARTVSGQDKAAKPDKKPHPHGAPPGLEQRDRNGPPPWSGGPDRRTEEPPGLAKKGQRN